MRALQARIDAVEHRLRQLDRRDVIRGRSADRLRQEADRIEDRLHRAARGGLNPYEANDIQIRIARLEQRVQYAMSGRFGGYGNNRYGYGQNGYSDRHDGDDRGNRDRDDDRYGDRDDN